MLWFATLLAHLLVLFLVVAVPIRGAQRYKVLMRRIDHNPAFRVQFYLRGMLGQWLMLLPLVLIVPGLGWSAQTLGLQTPDNAFLAVTFAVVLLVLVYLQVFYIRRVANSADGRAQLRTNMAGPLHMLPRTPRERGLWILLSLTAGFCEELLYRGFLPAYLVHIFPHVNLFFAVLIAAVLFGIGHVYQKLTGVLGTGALGLVFGLLYFFTGSLFLPMIVHALFDMRLMFLDIAALWTRQISLRQQSRLSERARAERYLLKQIGTCYNASQKKDRSRVFLIEVCLNIRIHTIHKRDRVQ
jgi:membrane protease YdiL (CAAX protease family)